MPHKMLKANLPEPAPPADRQAARVGLLTPHSRQVYEHIDTEWRDSWQLCAAIASATGLAVGDVSRRVANLFRLGLLERRTPGAGRQYTQIRRTRTCDQK
jgi:hypothetical protein